MATRRTAKNSTSRSMQTTIANRNNNMMMTMMMMMKHPWKQCRSLRLLLLLLVAVVFVIFVHRLVVFWYHHPEWDLILPDDVVDDIPTTESLLMVMPTTTVPSSSLRRPVSVQVSNGTTVTTNQTTSMIYATTPTVSATMARRMEKDSLPTTMNHSTHSLVRIKESHTSSTRFVQQHHDSQRSLPQARIKNKRTTKRQTTKKNVYWKDCSRVMDGLDGIDIMGWNTTNTNTSNSNSNSRSNSTSSSSRSSSNPPRQEYRRQRIYCFLMTHSIYHTTRVRAVWETWGPKCDYLLVASNETDPKWNAIRMTSQPTYQNLWNKLNETLHYIWMTTHQLRDYDWLLKVDDDTFVIMENLQYFLTTQQPRGTTWDSSFNQPIMYGRTFAWPNRLIDLKHIMGYFGLRRDDASNRPFGQKFFRNLTNVTEPLRYASGGAGYVMNKPYVQLLLTTLNSRDETLRGQPDEDMAVSINMWYQGIHGPHPTRDADGRERFHPELPNVMYHLYPRRTDWLRDFHKHIGGIAPGPECCSPTSISFHHANPPVQRYLYHQLYHCTKEREKRRRRRHQHQQQDAERKNNNHSISSKTTQ